MEREGLTDFAIADFFLLSSGNSFPGSPPLLTECRKLSSVSREPTRRLPKFSASRAVCSPPSSVCDPGVTAMLTGDRRWSQQDTAPHTARWRAAAAAALLSPRVCLFPGAPRKGSGRAQGLALQETRAAPSPAPTHGSDRELLGCDPELCEMGTGSARLRYTDLTYFRGHVARMKPQEESNREESR